MKVRVRQIPNGQWICETKSSFPFSKWKGSWFFEYATHNSVSAKKNARLYSPKSAGDSHYNLSWHKDKEGAERMKDEVVSHFNLQVDNL